MAGTITGRYVKFPDYVFNPLEESSEKERAENIRSYADVARSLIELGAKQADVFEWLKSFKDFHLDQITLDDMASGLDDYPDDDPNGGGLPDVFGMSNADWKESDHPRAPDGKFGAKDTGAIAVRGNELGGFNMTPGELRSAAVDYYKKNLAGTTVRHPELGDVQFSMGGYKKPISFSADARKLKLFPYLPDIIKRGTIIEKQDDKRDRQNVNAFYTIKCPVQIDDKPENVRLTVRSDSNGRLYYDHVIIKPLANSDRLNKSGLAKGVDNSITESDLVVNLFFGGE
ncbi:MAG: hypothetical protein K2L95_03135 [Alphaproteobacteria bacterium]|nr:hypothetical protein [Alphaproteobacteria bacterium]